MSTVKGPLLRLIMTVALSEEGHSAQLMGLHDFCPSLHQSMLNKNARMFPAAILRV